MPSSTTKRPPLTRERALPLAVDNNCWAMIRDSFPTTRLHEFGHNLGLGHAGTVELECVHIDTYTRIYRDVYIDAPPFLCHNIGLGHAGTQEPRDAPPTHPTPRLMSSYQPRIYTTVSSSFSPT